MNKYGLNKDDFDSYKEYRKAYFRLREQDSNRKLYRKEYNKKYQQTEGYQKYSQSKERKEYKKKYNQSYKHKECLKLYRQSEHGRNIRKSNLAKRRCAKIKRTPIWSELEQIKQFYINCPKGYHVDHIIPLQGKKVSGLHVLGNLQYLTAKENHRKNNRY